MVSDDSFDRSSYPDRGKEDAEPTAGPEPDDEDS